MKASSVQEKNKANNEYPPAAIAWTTVAALSLTNMFAFIDLNILVLLIEPIKADFNISDTQISLLTGLAFGVVYAIAAIPLARVADQWVRKYVILGCVVTWSLMTMLCGFARDFVQLFLLRMGVGIGEAGLLPSSVSMIADLFPPERLTRATTVFMLSGGVVGANLSLVFGGMVIGLVENIPSITVPGIGEFRPWQLALIAVGAASLLMVIPLALLKEPKRHNVCPIKTRADQKMTADQAHTSGDQPAPVLQDPDQPTLKAVLDYLWTNKQFYLLFIAGVCCVNTAAFGLAAWIPTYFIRLLDWTAASTGVMIGSLGITAGVAGGLFGAWLADHFYAKGYRGALIYLLIIVLALYAIAQPLFIYTTIMPLKLTVLGIAIFIGASWPGLVVTMLQMTTPNRMRGQLTAIFTLLINIIGVGLGPTIVALITDYVFQDEMAIGHSIAIVGLTAYGLGAVLLGFAIKPFKRQQQIILGT